jgi:hypothetical protein
MRTLIFFIFISLCYVINLHAVEAGSENVPDRIVIQKAKIFHNKKGLKDEIKIECPLRELRAISKSATETIEDLVEQTSRWIPKMYRDNFSINPMCIIILEQKINENNRAEIRFGVAMRCTAKFTVPKTINI